MVSLSALAEHLPTVTQVPSAVDYISKLPMELLLEIGSYLKTDTKTLSSLTRVSRQMRCIAEEFSYSSIVIPDSRHWRLLLLVRTLLERPDLAKRTTHLDIKTYDGGMDPYAPCFDEPSGPYRYSKENRALWTQIERSILEQCMAAQDAQSRLAQSSHSIRNCPPTNITGFLLSLFERVERFSLLVYDEPEEYIPNHKSAQAIFGPGDIARLCPLPTISSLASVRHFRTWGLNLELLYMLPCDELQSLQIELNIKSVTEGRGNSNTVHHLHNYKGPIYPLPSLKSLVLREYDRDIDQDNSYLELLRALECKNLKHFQYSLKCWPSWRKYYTGYFIDILETVKEVEHSLEHLVIDFSEKRRSDCDNMNFLRAVSGMKRFTSLKTLEVPAEMLLPDKYALDDEEPGGMRVDCLPPGLATLHIDCANLDIFEWVDELSHVCARYPHLREIQLDFSLPNLLSVTGRVRVGITRIRRYVRRFRDTFTRLRKTGCALKIVY